jgi:hypothetical protein
MLRMENTTLKFHFYHPDNKPFEEHDSILVEVIGAQWTVAEWPERMRFAGAGLAEDLLLELRHSADDVVAVVQLGRDIANIIPVIDDAMIQKNVRFATLIAKFKNAPNGMGS